MSTTHTYQHTTTSKSTAISVSVADLDWHYTMVYSSTCTSQRCFCAVYSNVRVLAQFAYLITSCDVKVLCMWLRIAQSVLSLWIAQCAEWTWYISATIVVTSVSLVKQLHIQNHFYAKKDTLSSIGSKAILHPWDHNRAHFLLPNTFIPFRRLRRRGQSLSQYHHAPGHKICSHLFLYISSLIISAIYTITNKDVLSC